MCVDSRPTEFKESELVKEHIRLAEVGEMFLVTLRSLQRWLARDGNEDEYTERAFRALYGAVYRRQNLAYQTAFMFGLCLDDADRDALKREAFRAFCRDGVSVMHLLYGHSPGAYPAELEKRFRAWLHEIFCLAEAPE